MTAKTTEAASSEKKGPSVTSKPTDANAVGNADAQAMLPFISDIEPFLYGKAITYIDVGANVGAVFRALLQSRANVRTALLVEPNPRAFKKLQEFAASVEKVPYLQCHNVALSSHDGLLSFHDEGGMTRVMANGAGASDNSFAPAFDMRATTLDKLIMQADISHIDLLKIDVEGHEVEVLKGAHDILSSRIIDVIYIEAGLERESRQQTYYRNIDDILHEYGFRPFRFYEQTNEWLRDSPLLRRTNIAFMSEEFASRNPYSITKKLFQREQKIRSLNREIKALKAKGPGSVRESVTAGTEDANKPTQAVDRLSSSVDKKQIDALKQITLERKDLQSEIASTKTAFLESMRSSLAAQIRAKQLDAELAAEKSALADAKVSLDTAHRKMKKLARASRTGMTLDDGTMLDPIFEKIESVVSIWRRRALNAKMDNDALLKYAERMKKRNLMLKSSLSWRVTMPLRFVVKLLFGGQDYRLGKMPKLKSKKWTKTPSLGFLRDLVGVGNKKVGIEKKSKVPQIILETEKRLWGGYSQWALNRYQTLQGDASLNPSVRADVFFRLATWYAVKGQYDIALEMMIERRRADPKVIGYKRQAVLEAYFLCRLSRPEEARALLDDYIQRKGSDADVELMYASTWMDAGEAGDAEVDEEKALAHINATYRVFGMAEIEKLDPRQPLSIDNVRGTVAAGTIDEATKVTVIVPVFNSENTVLTALKGLAAQTWKNLEVIVVDDFSTDGTADVVAAFCIADDRFTLLRQPYNRGSYFCRNVAIKQATGDFVTIHDADDWSHPERIELHVRDAQQSNSRANISNWMRARTDFVPVGTWRPTEKLISLNMGSFFVDRALFNEVGYWNEVRVSADREFIKRCELFLGGKVRTGIANGAPLTVGRSSETSLTRQSATHVATTYHGVRRDYHEVTDLLHRKWQEKTLGDLRTVGAMGGDLAPACIRAQRGQTEVDLLLIGNWNMRGGTFHSARNMAAAAKADGLSVGFFHYPSYDLEVTKPIRAEFREFLWSEGFKMVVAGEEVKARTVIFTYPPVLNEKIDLFPRISHERVFVVVNQMGERNISKTDVAYDPLKVRQNLIDLVGTEGEWAPISNRVREIMLADTRYPAPTADTWTPMTDIRKVDISSALWRGDERGRPRIGRHGRDHVLKWPSRREDIYNAYCVDKDCDIHFLGGAKHALKLLGSTPQNWRVDPFGSLDVDEFLSGLDFFLHFPDEDYIEEFGRAPMEAMAAGVPVILPPVFKSVFGEAAIYAEPVEVWTMVAELWKDKVAWQDRSEAGRRFVRENCAYSAFSKRIAAAKP